VVAAVEQRQMAVGKNNLRPQFIQFNRCQSVLIEEVRIRNSPFWTIRNVYVHDCTFINDDDHKPQNIVFVKTNRRRGGFVENVHVESIRARSTQFGVFGIETDVLYQWRDLVPTYEERLTAIRGIHVRNVQVEETGTPFTILGDERLPVKDVFLDNITIKRVRGRPSRYQHANNVQETNVRPQVLATEAEKGP
jgi:polygalacturonase